jgi:endonuclease/exonuclease/phosphatase family metal-dependent hydrolase
MLRAALAALLLVACVSAPPAESVDTSAPVAWRVVSYNIRHGEGMDGRVDLERTADVLRRLDPDVVALQEVDQRVERSGGEDQAARLGALLGMNHAFGSFMDYQGGRYGMAILSHCEIQHIESVRLTDGNEPRVALVTELTDVNDSTLTVVDVHFDWVADDGFRFSQAGEVARHLDDVSGRWVLIGDFNDRPGSRTLDLFHARAMETVKPRDRRFTFPSGDPEREIDFIFAAPGDAWRVETVDVVAESVASDHRPVFAELVPLGSAGGEGHRPACPR